MFYQLVVCALVRNSAKSWNVMTGKGKRGKRGNERGKRGNERGKHGNKVSVGKHGNNVSA